MISGEIASAYRGKRVLITGHSGFKGSWLTRALWLMGASVYGYSRELPKDSKAAFWALGISGLLQNSDNQLGDVRDRDLLLETIQEVQPDFLFHLAAQAFVTKSYKDPSDTFTTNVVGTLNILDCTRVSSASPTLIMVTSDKSYRPFSPPRVHEEGDVLWGFDPYSASKAAAEQVIECYIKNFSESIPGGISVVRAGNVFGGGDWSENRLVPDFFRALEANLPLEVRMPNATRPWTMVLDVLRGYLIVGARSRLRTIANGQAWNFASGETLAVSEVVSCLSHELNAQAPNLSSASNSIAEVAELQISAQKAIEKLGWQPKFSVKDSLDLTAAWYSQQLSGLPMETASDEMLETYLGEK
jgi:CDP-glucose 4,6-dehydratase